MIQIPAATIKRLKKATDLAALVNEYTPITKRGTQWWGLCPFHKDSHATNFTVHPSGFYRCHACGAKGDAFSFLQNLEGLSFSSAAELLSDRTGISLDGRKVNRAQAAYEREQRAVCDWWWNRQRRMVLDAERAALDRERVLCAQLRRLCCSGYWNESHDAPAYLVAMGRMDLQCGFEVELEEFDIGAVMAESEFADSCGRILAAMDDMLFPERLGIFLRHSTDADRRAYVRDVKASAELLAWWCGLNWDGITAAAA